VAGALLLGAASVWLPGCFTRVAAPQALPAQLASAPAAWARVLARHVDAEGRVDFEALRAEAKTKAAAADLSDLETYVAWVATASPRTRPDVFPDWDAARAYWINAYNALAMHNGTFADVGPEDQFRFYKVRRFNVGGQELTLQALQDEVLRKLGRPGDPRIHFATSCMARSCPRLQKEPFVAERLDAQLDATARAFFNDPAYVQVDAAAKVVRFSALLDRFQQDFLAVAPSLTAYANRFRTERIPADYKVEFLPFDWSLAAQQPPASAAAAR
jgi:hypothetical protein